MLKERVAGLVEQRLQRVGVGGVAGLGALGLRHLQLVEQHHLQLLGRAEVDLLPDHSVRRLRGVADLVGELALQLGQLAEVNGDARGLHLGQHPLDRQLHVAQQRGGLDAGQLLVERIGEVHHRAGPQDRRLDRLLVNPVGVIEQRKLLLLRVIRAQLTLQVPQRQVVEREASLAGPNQIGGQRGVRRDTAQRPAAAFQVVHRELRLVQRLRHRGVGKPRRERGLVVGMQVGGVEIATVAVGCHDRQRCRVRVEGEVCPDDRHAEPAAGAALGQPRGQFACLQCAAAHVETLVDLGVRRCERLEQPLPQHAELEVVEQPVDLVAIPRLHAQRVGGLRQRHVLDEIGELAVEHDVGQVGAQRIADLALHGVDLVDERLQRAVFGDPLGRGLLPHARNAGKVVARIAAQRGEVRILLRGQPVLLEHRLRCEPGQLADALARVQHRDVVADQLQRVAVAGDHQHPVAGVLGLRRQRGDARRRPRSRARPAP